MLNEIVSYFDLQSRQRPSIHAGAARATAADQSHAPVLPQYAAVAAGVLVDPLLRRYIDSQTFNFDFWSLLTRAGFALLMGILLLPAVYKNAFDPEKPSSCSFARCLRRGSAGSLCSKPRRGRQADARESS
jgi:hypothetical protein